ncbi:helix-turn-helix domain-containing protein [Treponema sp. HNW]|uniref:helix-turn-helix domain-containing protein n=1 Tax=Treponema sp. HNW TaxID=3116654 RepID=UPI003D0E82AD
MAENKAFESIMNGLTESFEYANGNPAKARKMCIKVAELPAFRDMEIKQIRKDLNLTQRNFAFVLGVSPKTVEAWESGKNMPQGSTQRFLQILRFGGKKMLEDFNVISVAKKTPE